MNKNMDQDVLRWRAIELERSFQKDDAPQDLEDFLEFHMMGLRYAIRLHHLDTVGRVDEVSVIPVTPPHVTGVIWRRGQPIALISLRHFFYPNTRGVADADYVLVVIADQKRFALQVENFEGVCQLDKKAILPPPDNFAPEQLPYISGVTKDGLAVLDLLKLVQAKGFAVS